MNHPYIKTVFLTYIAVMTFIGLFTNNIDVKAEEIDVRVTEEVKRVYQLEMNRADFTEIKKDILLKDVKYMAYPEKFINDLSLSEIVISGVDYASTEVQRASAKLIKYTDSKEGKQVLDTVELEVDIQYKDTLAPTLNLSRSSLEVQEGGKFDPSKYIEVLEDNDFVEPKLSIDNSVNLNKVGKYNVVYTASDASGNTVSETLVVNVTEKPKPKEVAPVVKKNTATTAMPKPAGGSVVEQTLYYINQYRAAEGKYPLKLGGPSEMSATQLRAQEAVGYKSHTRPDGRSYKTAFTDIGLSHENVVEVLVFGLGGPAEKVKVWMNSPVHRNVLMRTNITHIALGVSGSLYAGIVYK